MDREKTIEVKIIEYPFEATMKYTYGHNFEECISKSELKTIASRMEKAMKTGIRKLLKHKI